MPQSVLHRAMRGFFLDRNHNNDVDILFSYGTLEMSAGVVTTRGWRKKYDVA